MSYADDLTQAGCPPGDPLHKMLVDLNEGVQRIKEGPHWLSPEAEREIIHRLREAVTEAAVRALVRVEVAGTAYSRLKSFAVALALVALGAWLKGHL